MLNMIKAVALKNNPKFSFLILDRRKKYRKTKNDVIVAFLIHSSEKKSIAKVESINNYFL
tara:strand:+ start:203 stop:382 length:180 start_codon:yes stop_codon:yes gene_type:complete